MAVMGAVRAHGRCSERKNHAVIVGFRRRSKSGESRGKFRGKWGGRVIGRLYNSFSVMALDPGTRLGPYEIQSALGVGGMGEVYVARDTRLDRAVAIKVLRAHLADDPDRRARFEREARLISQLDHPHIWNYASYCTS